MDDPLKETNELNCNQVTISLHSEKLNSIRVPLIILLAFSKNSTNVFKSRTDRQIWEMEMAQKERREKIEAKNLDSSDRDCVTNFDSTVPLLLNAGPTLRKVPLMGSQRFSGTTDPMETLLSSRRNSALW